MWGRWNEGRVGCCYHFDSAGGRHCGGCCHGRGCATVTDYYPEAEWVPWAYNTGDGPAYFRGLNQPIAAVLHIAQGYSSTARQWAITGHYGASWHYTVCRDGRVLQHLLHSDGGYHAGIPATAPTPTWSLWRGHGTNVNRYTIGIEHEGFSGVGFTPEQAAASKRLCRWLAEEIGFPYDREHFPAHAEIDLINRPNDFAPPEDREAHYRYMFKEDDMTPAEVEALVNERLDAVLPAYYRGLTRAYWDRNVAGAYTDPPDAEVVAAIREATATGFAGIPPGLRFSVEVVK